MTQLRREIRTIRGETRYCIVGPKGGLDFHFSDITPHVGHEWVSAGLEIHSRAPFDYMREKEPMSMTCWLLDGPCWHEGTSLYATEVLYPQFTLLGIEGFWPVLEREYHNRFNTQAEDGA